MTKKKARPARRTRNAGTEAEADLAEQIMVASAHPQPLRIAGGRTKLALGERVRAEGQVSTIALSGIAEYEPGALSVVVGAGTQWDKLNGVLKAENQRLAFEPPDYRGILNRAGEPTIGGIVACGLSGPGRVRFGACRDALIGVRFINGRGEIIRSGGKVMKNVTGYDLVKLLCGSYGTLGVLTEVAFKTAPLPICEKTLIIEGLDDAGGVSALRQALGTPYEVTGAAHCNEHEPETLIRLEGEEAGINRRVKALQELLRGDTKILDRAESENRWRRVRDLGRFRQHTGPLWRISIKPTAAPGYVRRLKRSLELEALYDWGGGLIWIELPPGQADGGEIIRGALADIGGHATRVRHEAGVRQEAGARKVSPAFHPLPPALAKMAGQLRAAFDPQSILNPGLFGAGPSGDLPPNAD